jgi:hypothetical protein
VSYREGDLIDVTFRRAVVRHVNTDGTLAIIHVNEELDRFDPNTTEVEVTVVGREPTCPECGGEPDSKALGCATCCGTGRVFR